MGRLQVANAQGWAAVVIAGFALYFSSEQVKEARQDRLAAEDAVREAQAARDQAEEALNAAVEASKGANAASSSADNAIIQITAMKQETKKILDQVKEQASQIQRIGLYEIGERLGSMSLLVMDVCAASISYKDYQKNNDEFPKALLVSYFFKDEICKKTLNEHKELIDTNTETLNKFSSLGESFEKIKLKLCKFEDLIIAWKEKINEIIEKDRDKFPLEKHGDC